MMACLQNGGGGGQTPTKVSQTLMKKMRWMEKKRKMMWTK
jgi:hypothetical protein